MKSDKHLKKKEEILDTAFAIWHENCYLSTSLNDIAEKLGMTKQAIYRYFSGKKGLIESMNERILQRHTENFESLQKTLSSQNKFNSLQRIITDQYDFYKENIEHLSFLTSQKMMTRPYRENHIKLLRNKIHFFMGILSIGRVEANYIINIILFSVLYDIEKENLLTLITEGLGLSSSTLPTNYKEIIENNTIPENDDEDENTIFKAISQVVLENGIENASIEKIAKEAGISKSSLYFYFNNKEEMISESINKKIERYVLYHHHALSNYKVWEEQFLAHLVMTASMSVEKQMTVSRIHWFIKRGLGNKFHKPTDYPQYSEYFERAHKKGLLNTYDMDMGNVIFLVNFCMTFEIYNDFNKDLEKEEKYGLVIPLFNLFLHGLKEHLGE